MTQGEKMVWAAAFALSQAANKGWMTSRNEADDAVFGYRSARAHSTGLGERFEMEECASTDVEAALVEALAKCERDEMFFKEPCTAAGRFRKEVVARIGRPLRGVK